MPDDILQSRCPLPTLLDGHRFQVAPDWFGIGILLVILVVALQTGLNLALGLVALLLGVSLVSILHAWRNLAGIRAVPLHPAAVFAGETACFPVQLAATGQDARWAIRVRTDTKTATSSPETVHVPPVGQVIQEIHLPTTRRGWLALTGVWIETDYPLGLARVRTPLDGTWQCLVYPQPEQASLPLPVEPGGSIGQGQGSGEDDLADLRLYHPGDPLHKIHWKSSAKRDELLVREFSGHGEPVVWLQWERLAMLDDEARLSRLCRWVLDADAMGVTFGLRVPGVTIAPARGDAHCVQCLTALALHDVERLCNP
ncbi:MAG: DUF58 domain-containing protein [Magnetococcus sp. DMHC-1]|nr:DUF58 domain-containing protein [Magnetococcales bacterium]